MLKPMDPNLLCDIYQSRYCEVRDSIIAAPETVGERFSRRVEHFRSMATAIADCFDSAAEAARSLGDAMAKLPDPRT